MSAAAALTASWIYNVVIMPHDQQSAVARVCGSQSECVLVHMCARVCNGKNSACPLAMCVFLIQEFLHVYICEYVFMFQSVCALHVCVHGKACQGQSTGEHVAGEDKSQGVGMRRGEKVKEEEEWVLKKIIM